MNFKLLQEFVDDLNSSNSTLHKKAILSDGKYNDQFIKDVLVATFDPFKKYYVTPDNLIKNSGLVNCQGLNLFELLDKLSNREVTGHDAIALVNGFVVENVQYKELIHNIFDRNLKTRTTASIINKIHKKLIPVFDVALAYTYENFLGKKDRKTKELVIDFKKRRWLASRKLDGLRCLVIIDHEGNIEIKSRTGIPFITLALVVEEVRKLNLSGVVFDGEICIVKDNGDEDFKAIHKLYNKKNFTIPNPRYKIFDMLTLEEFNAQEGDRILSTRVDILNVTIPNDNEILSVVEHILVKDEAHLQELRDMAAELSWEGLIVRKDVEYKGKRTNDLLKCKLWKEAEYIVLGTVLSEQRIIAKDENGNTHEVTETLLKAVYVDHKGFRLDVGSGFTLVERRLYRDHPELIVGKQITAKYFEGTTNEKGGISVRFGTFKCLWEGEDGRDV